MASGPVIYSTFSGEAVKTLVLPHYGFGESAACVLFRRGLNDTYRVSANNDRLALRLYRHRWRTEVMIRDEIAALLHLKGAGFPVAAPLAREDGEWLTPVQAPEGLRWAVLFHWVSGSEPYVAAPHATLYGEMVARMHTATDNMRPGVGRKALDADYLLNDPSARLRSLMKSRPPLASRFDALVDRTSTRLESARARLGDWGFCHGDLNGGNAHLDADRLVLFDFDCCGQGWRAYDIATYRWSVRARAVAEQAWTSFIEAYLRARPEARDILEYVPLFVVLRHIWLHGHYAWDAQETGTGYQSDKYLDELVSFLERVESEPI